MSEYKIDKDIPLVVAKSNRSKYPLARMEVGDSFAFPAVDKVNAQGAVSYYGKKLSRKFSVRKSPEGYRCWRVK